jgi:hypothetical protein
MSTVNTALDQSRKLAPPVDDAGAEAAKSMLGALAAGIRRFAGDDASLEDTGEG